jgi:hypothetical protein
MTEDFSRVGWSEHLEDYFKDTGEKSHGRAWCHKKAEAMFSRRLAWIDLPIMIGSGAIAFLNGASTNIFNDAKISSIALGVGSFFVGILGGVNTYYGWSKRSEGHRIASIQYSRLFRFLRIELGLPREERMTPQDLLRFVKDADDRLQETTPLLPPEIVNEFQSRFGKETTIAKPDEVNGLEEIVIWKPRLPNETSSPRPVAPLGIKGEMLGENHGELVIRPVVRQEAPKSALALRTVPSQQSEVAETVLEPVDSTNALSTPNT